MRRIMMLACALLGAAGAASGQVLTLEDCRRMAVEGNNGVLNAELDVLSAKAQREEALTLWFPSVSVAAVGFKTKDPLLSIGLEDITGKSVNARKFNAAVSWLGDCLGFDTSWSFVDGGYMASALLTQPVFAGGRIYNGNKLASLGVEAARVQHSIAERESSDEVDRKFWTLISLQDKMGALDEALSMIDVLGEDVRNACLAGLALDSDTLRVSRERSKLLLDKARLESGIRLARTDLANYIGYSGEDLDEIVFSGELDDVLQPSAYYEDAFELASGTEESQLLDLQVRAAGLQKKITTGEALPQVAVGASYGYGKIYGDPAWNGIAFASVSIPITDWWKTSAKARRAEYQIRKAENDKDYLTRQLALKADLLWNNMTTVWEALAIGRESVRLNELTEQRTRDLYDVGGATLSELLMARVDLRTSRSELVDAQIAYRTAVSEYLSLRKSSDK